MAIVTRRNGGKASIQVGNAFGLIGEVANLGRQMGWTRDQIKEVQAEMTSSSSYDDLLKVFDKHFGEVVDLLVEGDDDGDDDYPSDDEDEEEPECIHCSEDEFNCMCEGGFEWK